MAITSFYGIKILQCANTYEAYVPLGYKVFVCTMPNDGQILIDSNVMGIVSKMLSVRWQIVKAKKKNEHRLISRCFFGLVFNQINVSEYEIYLPDGNQVAWVLFPPDGQYCEDAIALSCICRALAIRYGLTDCR